MYQIVRQIECSNNYLLLSWDEKDSMKLVTSILSFSDDLLKLHLRIIDLEGVQNFMFLSSHLSRLLNIDMIVVTVVLVSHSWVYFKF